MIKKKALLILLLCFCLSGCTKKDEGIRIAEQFGIAYAPLEIMREMHYLEQALPGVNIEWKQFGGPTGIREGFVSGDIDFGFMGVAPALIGIDSGMGWKIASGISSNDSALVTDKENVHTLHDLAPSERIAVLSPGCTQHVLLSMLAEQQLGDPTAFDNRIVAMTHPDAMNALMADTEIAAHFATPPYLGSELAAGMHIIASGEQIVGEPFTFIISVVKESFREEKPHYYQAFIEALQRSIDYINSDIPAAAQLLGPYYGINAEELLAQMQYQGTIYSSRVTGIDTISAAMTRMGFIHKDLTFEDICFENVQH